MVEVKEKIIPPFYWDRKKKNIVFDQKYLFELVDTHGLPIEIIQVLTLRAIEKAGKCWVLDNE